VGIAYVVNREFEKSTGANKGTQKRLVKTVFLKSKHA
jgi:hypothetical protein